MENSEDEVKATQPSIILLQPNSVQASTGNPFHIEQNPIITLQDTTTKHIDLTPPNQPDHKPITDSPNVALAGKRKDSSAIHKNPLLRKLSGTFSDKAAATKNTNGLPHSDLFLSVSRNEDRMSDTELESKEKRKNQSTNTLLTKQSTPVDKKELTVMKKGVFTGIEYSATNNNRLGCNAISCCTMV